MLKYCLSSSITGRYGVVPPYEAGLDSRISQSAPGCECRNWFRKRDLPTPASPTIATTWPRPPAATCLVRLSCSSSASRLTKRVKPRAAAACKRVRAAPAPVSSYTGIAPRCLSPAAGRGVSSRRSLRPISWFRLRQGPIQAWRVAPSAPRGAPFDRRLCNPSADRYVRHERRSRLNQSDSNREQDSLGALNLVGVPLDIRLHSQGRITGAHRVVLMGDRRSE